MISNGFIYSWTGNANQKWEFIENTSEARENAIQNGADRFSIMVFESEPTEENPCPMKHGDLIIDFDSKKDKYFAV